jgi:hypothetical protein
LAGCAPQTQSLWLKPGAGTDEFQQDRYACLQGAQQPSSSAYVGRYGGAASSGMITNGGLFDACMNAKGWSLTPVTDAKGFNDAARPILEERAAICSRSDLQVLWRKTPCKLTNEVTQAELGDHSKVSSEEKIALLKWQDAAISLNERAALVYRQYDTKNGDAMAGTLENVTVNFKQDISELSTAKISWGEFNRRRSESNKRLQESQKMALSN